MHTETDKTMVKIVMTVKKDDTSSPGWEEKLDVSIDELARVYAKSTVDSFNNSLRLGEERRKLVRVEVESRELSKEHAWEKSNLITIAGPGGIYDTYKCFVCGITGKRFGLSSNIVYDKKFRSDEFKYCRDVPVLHKKEEVKTEETAKGGEMMEDELRKQLRAKIKAAGLDWRVDSYLASILKTSNSQEGFKASLEGLVEKLQALKAIL